MRHYNNDLDLQIKSRKHIFSNSALQSNVYGTIDNLLLVMGRIYVKKYLFACRISSTKVYLPIKPITFKFIIIQYYHHKNTYTLFQNH